MPLPSGVYGFECLEGALGCLLETLGVLLKSLGVPSGAHVGPFGQHRRPLEACGSLWVPLKCLCGALVMPWGAFGFLWDVFGVPFGQSESDLQPFCSEWGSSQQGVLI